MLFSDLSEDHRIEVRPMAKCPFTGKKPSFGHHVSHSKRRTRRMWKPNIQTVTMTDEHGNRRQVRMCTRFLRTLYKVR